MKLKYGSIKDIPQRRSINFKPLSPFCLIYGEIIGAIRYIPAIAYINQKGPTIVALYGNANR